MAYDVYVVVRGDTLWGIAQDKLGDGSRFSELATLNGIENPNLIYPGQKIKYPVPDPPAPPPPPADPPKPVEPSSPPAAQGVDGSSSELDLSKADNEFRAAEGSALEATARVIGNPLLRAKRTVMIRGVGKKYSGLWWLSEVRHVIDSNGYTCELKLTKNAHKASAGKKTGGDENSQTDTDASQATSKPSGSGGRVFIDANSGEVKK